MSLDELESPFEELHDEFRKLGIQNIVLKKLLSNSTIKNESLSNKIEEL